MFAKYMTAGLVGSALLATVAFAQSPTATTDRANTAPAAASDSSFQGTWRASKIVGLNVYNDNNESLGSTNTLLTDKNEKSNVAQAPVAYTGAAAGPSTGASRPASSTSTTGAANPPASATASKPNPWYPDHAVFNATKDELKAMPEFKYST